MMKNAPIMKKFLLGFYVFGTVSVIAILSSCSSSNSGKSSATGWQYNDPKNGGFEVKPYFGQATGPGLVFIEGGRFTMGNVEQNVTYDNDNTPRTVTVSSFYMDQTEVSNVNYLEYLYWLQRTFGADFPEVYRRALPDTNCWRSDLAYNEPFVQYYLRHPAYRYYPVVGVSWVQATEYCKWRTDRVNENILITQGVLSKNPNQVNEDNYNTEAYLVGQYEGLVKRNLKDLNPNGTGTRKVRMEDGILLPDYRLPTEAEWEYAALGLIGNNPFAETSNHSHGEEIVTDRKIYPWNSNSLRNGHHGSWQGEFLANFKRDRGDYMGVAGGLNDNSDITAPVLSNMPNDFGLYNMAGNVSEWVKDVYRPMTSYDESDLDPYRGNVFKKKVTDKDGVPVDKDSLGRVVYTTVSAEENSSRRNYKRGDVINYLDGDSASEVAYNYSVSTLINDKARVYKGGSWADLAYYLSPGTRRFLDEDQSTCTIGFRCAMSRVGSADGNGIKSGNYFKTNTTKRTPGYFNGQ